MKWILAAAALALTLAPAAAQTGDRADELVGLWASETQFPATLRGDLVVTRAGDSWRAAIGGETTQFAADGRSIRFSFGAHGSFRGALRNGRIEGLWLQPSARAEGRDDPTATGQAFASALLLRRDGANRWRGEVAPLEGGFNLYLRIFRNSDGALIGAFRNPEVNSRGGASQFRLSQDGEAVHFLARFDDGQEVRQEAVLLRDPERLRIEWGDLERTLELHRIAPGAARQFLPAPADAPPYAYSRPPETGDGWRTADAGDTGLDEAALAQLVQRLRDGDPSARRPNLIHSILVAHRGRLVLEEYFFGTDRETLHDIRSVGKTFGSVMLGAVMREGAHIGPETRVYDLLAGMGPFAEPDPRKHQITIAHLMTHTAGLDCDDNNENSRGNEGMLQTQTEQPNWWKYTLDLALVHEPGAHYAYCSANENLVGAALTTATGVSLPELFDARIARPLQFGRYFWNVMPNGEGYLGGGAFMRPRDLLKLGQTYLNGGVWNGRRIVSEDWVRASTSARIEITPATTGLSEEEFSNFYSYGVDGYAWHRYGVRVGEVTVEEYEANGNGGQFIIVVPDYDLAVVFTGGNYLQGGIWTRWRDEIVGAVIIPAIAD